MTNIIFTSYDNCHIELMPGPEIREAAPRFTMIKPPKAISFLGTIDIFQKLPHSELALLESQMTERKFKKNEPIFLEGDPAKYIWFIKEGRVKAVKHLPQGRDLTICTMGKANMFGTCCCFAAENYPCNSVAESDTTVVSVPMAEFLSWMAKYPEISKGLVSHLSKRLRQSKDMQSFDQENVEKRILHVLTNLVGEFGAIIPLTRKEIAEMAGTTVETCIRTFRELEEEGMVETSRGRITVKDFESLAEHRESIN
jgi:CRP/FNR family transcriptional regulator, nitrogen oxide reductase regulator